MNHEDSETLLNSILENEIDDALETKRRDTAEVAAPTADEKEVKKPESHSQWALGPNGTFMPVGATVPKLRPGVYQAFSSPGSWGVEEVEVISDGLYQLPDMATDVVLSDVRRFWDRESRYREHNLLYKRGILMWGSPGSGKTVAVKLLMNELVSSGGIVVIVNNVALTTMALKAIKRIEPERNLIVVFEDIDEIIGYSGEAQVLSLLDGEASIDRVLNIATTNYPERLGARIVNRPSRFDRRIHVGMPSAEARRAYITKKTSGNITLDVLDKWVKDTDTMSIAHLRELVAAVYCLDQPYDEVIQRLKDMTLAPKPETGFRNGKNLGFQAISMASSAG